MLHEIDKGPPGGREVSAGIPHEVDVPLEAQSREADGRQGSGADLGFHGAPGHDGDADAATDGMLHGGGAADDGCEPEARDGMALFQALIEHAEGAGASLSAHKGFFRKLVEGDLLSTGPWVRRWHDDHELVLPQADELQAAGGGAGADEADFHVPGLDLLQDDLRIGDAKVEHDLRVLVAETSDEMGQDVLARNGAGADADFAALEPEEALHLQDGPLSAAEEVDCVPVQGTPDRGRDGASPQAVEEPASDLRLEVADALTDGRLRKVELRGGCGEAAALHDAAESLKLSQVQVHAVPMVIMGTIADPSYAVHCQSRPSEPPIAAGDSADRPGSGTGRPEDARAQARVCPLHGGRGVIEVQATPQQVPGGGMGGSRTTRTWIWLLIAALVLVGGSLFHVVGGYSHWDRSGHAWGSDDAYISYRYAANLAAGEGLVYNPGERVEGYTNLLYVLAMTPVCAFAERDAVYTWSALLNLLFALSALVLYWHLARRHLSEGGAAAAAGLLAVAPSLWLWVAAGLEAPLVLALQVGTWLQAERLVDGPRRRDIWLAGLFCSLSVLARADGFIFPVLAAGWLVVRGHWRAGSVCLAATLATLGGVVAWRLGYYGHPLPNTYYVKVSGPLLDRLAEGAGQLWQLALGQRLLPALMLLAGLAVVASWRALSRRRLAEVLRLDLTLAAGLLVYWHYVGGDVFGERFLLVLYPMGALLALRGLELSVPRLLPGLHARLPWLGPVAGLVLLGLVQVSAVASDSRFSLPGPEGKYDRWVNLGQFLAVHHPEATLATDAAGKIAFFSGLHTVDVLGLTDEHIGHQEVDFFSVGHNKYDPDYTLSRQPDLIAVWLLRNGDGFWGLTRARYEAAGYRVRYLVQAGAHAPKVWLADVGSWGPKQIAALHSRGFQYAVLERSVRDRLP